MKTSIFILFAVISFTALSGINRSFNASNQQPQEKGSVYLSKNEKGITEILILKMLPNGNVKEIAYSTSKSKKQTKLIISTQSKNYLEVMFPGEKVVYKLKIYSDYMICDNLDKTSQDYCLISDDGIDWDKTKTIIGIIINAGVEQGLSYFTITDEKNKEHTFLTNPEINGENIVIQKDNVASLKPQFKGIKVKVSYKLDISYMDGGIGACGIDEVQKVELVK